jgi:hypothetical protein
MDSQISIGKELLQYLTPFKSYRVPKFTTVIEVKVHSLGLLKYVFEKLLWFIFIFLELREDPFRITEHFFFFYWNHSLKVMSSQTLVQSL